MKTWFGLGVGKCGIGSSATKSQGNVQEFYSAWRVVTLCCEFHYILFLPYFFSGDNIWIDLKTDMFYCFTVYMYCFSGLLVC